VRKYCGIPDVKKSYKVCHWHLQHVNATSYTHIVDQVIAKIDGMEAQRFQCEDKKCKKGCRQGFAGHEAEPSRNRWCAYKATGYSYRTAEDVFSPKEKDSYAEDEELTFPRNTHDEIVNRQPSERRYDEKNKGCEYHEWLIDQILVSKFDGSFGGLQQVLDSPQALASEIKYNDIFVCQNDLPQWQDCSTCRNGMLAKKRMRIMRRFRKTN